MNPVGEVLVGLVILVGLAGIVVPVLPGLVLVVGAVLVWSLEESTTLGWIVFGAAVVLAAAATVIKYLVPGRKLQESGIPFSTMMLAVAGAIIGFFAIPVVGGPIGFMAAIYLLQWRRLGRDAAWPATVKTAEVIALSIGIELGGALLIAGIWLAAALLG